MSHFKKGILRDIEEVITEEEVISHTGHKKSEKILLSIRNCFVFAAAVMFIIAIIFGHAPILKATAYFLGAGGYLAELLFLTDLFRVRLHPEELFMVYCFGPLYILMGLSYVFVS